MERTGATFQLDDPLKLMRVGLFKMQNDYRGLIWIIFVSQIIISILHIYYMIFVFNSKQNLMFLPLGFGYVYGFMCCFNILIRPTWVEKIFDELLSISWNYDLDEKLARYIRIHSTVLKSYFVIDVLLAVISGFTVAFNSPETFVFGAYLFETVLPEYGSYLYPLYGVQHLPYSILPLLPTYTLMYGSMIAYYQVKILLYNFEMLSQDNDCDTAELKYDNLYQKKVRFHLISCIKVHQKLRSIATASLDKLQLPIMIYTLLGLGISMSFVLTISMDAILHQLNYPRMISLGAATMMAVIAIGYAGQLMTDVSNEFFDVVAHLPYTNWNKENQQMLLILLTRTFRTFKIEFSIITLDYSLFLRLLKPAYSASTIFKNLSNRKFQNIP